LLSAVRNENVMAFKLMSDCELVFVEREKSKAAVRITVCIISDIFGTTWYLKN
jgi:hypothetical protein